MTAGRSARVGPRAGSVTASSTRSRAAGVAGTGGCGRATGARLTLGRPVTRLTDGRPFAEANNGTPGLDLDGGYVVDPHGLVGPAHLERQTRIGIEPDLAVYRSED